MHVSGAWSVDDDSPGRGAPLETIGDETSGRERWSAEYEGDAPSVRWGDGAERSYGDWDDEEPVPTKPSRMSGRQESYSL